MGTEGSSLYSSQRASKSAPSALAWAATEYLHQAYLTDRAYDKFQENKLWYELLYDHMLEDSSVYFTDEMLRQYFAENYATLVTI